MFYEQVDRNASSFKSVYRKAELMFEKLDRLARTFRPYVILGQIGGAAEVEALIEQTLTTVADFELNIKALKVKAKDAEKLPK